MEQGKWWRWEIYSSSNGSFRWIFWRIATTTLALHFTNTIQNMYECLVPLLCLCCCCSILILAAEKIPMTCSICPLSFRTRGGRHKGLWLHTRTYERWFRAMCAR
jgi:hypothetical protein